ncbi:MAG: ABC transporter ATP-binding protein [Kiritimatiellaeota bacterium]|nr:ABC transporter ATP-binding protein [Kiritimatiellota bacterium]
MLHVRSLSKLFRGRRALDGVSFTVPDGAKVAVLGGNGAGKSTLLRILAGVIPPTSGSVVIDGADMFFAPPESRLGTGYMPEEAPLYPDMRVKEYLKFCGKLRGMKRAHLTRRMHDVLALCDLAPQSATIVSRLSHGERRRVALAAALLHEPRLLILDDPTAGLDEHHTSQIAALLTSTSLSATTILFATHSPTLAPLATQTITLSSGRMQLQ